MSIERRISKKILKIGGFAVAAIILSYLIYRVSEILIPIVSKYLETLGAAERLFIYAIAIVILGTLLAIPMWIIYKKVVLRHKFNSSIKDERRRLLITTAGTISKLVLNMKERDTYVTFPKELQEIFETRAIILAYNPDEGGVAKFVKKIGGVVREFIGKIPAYIITVRHSKQNVTYAVAQRNAELDKVTGVVNEINSKHGSFSSNLSILGYGITGLTCNRLFPKPNADVLITIVVADRRRRG